MSLIFRKITGFSRIGLLELPLHSGQSEIALSLRFPPEIYRLRFCEHYQKGKLRLYIKICPFDNMKL